MLTCIEDAIKNDGAIQAHRDYKAVHDLNADQYPCTGNTHFFIFIINILKYYCFIYILISFFCQESFLLHTL